jgi:hypothetical protein
MFTPFPSPPLIVTSASFFKIAFLNALVHFNDLILIPVFCARLSDLISSQFQGGASSVALKPIIRGYLFETPL